MCDDIWKNAGPSTGSLARRWRETSLKDDNFCLVRNELSRNDPKLGGWRSRDLRGESAGLRLSWACR
jgi:hypothetical protein